MTVELNFDMEKQVEFLIELLKIHSPTGYHKEAIEYVQQAFEFLEIPDLSLSLTKKGGLMAVWKGESSEMRRGITAHADTLGLMVKEINSNGSLTVTNLGSITWPAIEYENVTVRTFDDRHYRGTVILNNPSSHVNRDVHSQKRNSDTMEIRLDVKTSSAVETRELGIEVGDFVFLDQRIEAVDTGFIRSRFLDDKASVANIYGAMLALKQAGLRPSQDVAILISNYEEVGHGGASGWPFELDELLAVDMAAIGNGQNSDEFSVSICVKDGSGPYHFDMVTKLRGLCEEHKIPYKTDIYVYYSSDGSAYWRSGQDARVGLIGPGVASSHGYERTHKDTLLHSTNLIARYMLS